MALQMMQRNIKLGLHVSASPSDETGAGMLAPKGACTRGAMQPPPPPAALQAQRHPNMVAVKLSLYTNYYYSCIGTIKKLKGKGV